MKDINTFVNEFLISKDKKNQISKDKDPKDPITWEIGDVIWGYYGSTVSLPRFYRITKQRLNDFSVERLKGEVIEGERNNGRWKEIPTDELFSDKELTGKIYHNNKVKVNNDIEVFFYEGKPIIGYANLI